MEIAFGYLFPIILTNKKITPTAHLPWLLERDINGLVIHQTGDKIPQIELRNTSKFLSNSGNLNNGTLFFQKRKIRFARQKFQKMICRGRPAFFPSFSSLAFSSLHFSSSSSSIIQSSSSSRRRRSPLRGSFASACCSPSPSIWLDQISDAYSYVAVYHSAQFDNI